LGLQNAKDNWLQLREGLASILRRSGRLEWVWKCHDGGFFLEYKATMIQAYTWPTLARQRGVVGAKKKVFLVVFLRFVFSLRQVLCLQRALLTFAAVPL
jgi:hypothetical protein